MTSLKNMVFLAILLVTLRLTLPLTAGELTVVDDGNGGLILSSDAVGPKPPADCRVFPLVGENVRIRKTFDLSAVSQEKLQELQNASLQIYWEVADQSVAVRKKPQKNGLTETIFVKINGHELQFSTSDELRITWHRLWKEIPFPAEWLKPTENVVEIGKVGPDGDNDDFVYVGIDTSRQPIWSENSDDQGRTFRKDWPANPEAVGEYLIRLHLAAHQTEYHVDFAKSADASKVALQGKAEIRNGKLKLSGQNDYAVLVGTEDFNITPSGLTFNVVMRQDIPSEDSQKKDNNVLLGLKQRSWFVGRTKDLYNISFTQSGSSMTWNKAVVEGDFPPLETWVQQTVVFRHVHDSGRGVDGYEINVYSDGELQLRRFYDSLQPEVTIEPVLLGGNKTWKDYFFCGEIASVSLYRRPLSEEEIAGLSKGNPLLRKLPAGYNEIQPEVIQALQARAAQDASPQGQWLISALRRAAATGFPQQKILAVLEKAKDVSGNAHDFAAKWNSCAQGAFTMLEKQGFLLLIVQGGASVTSPVLGFYNPITQADVLDGRGPGWKILCGNSYVNNFDQGVTYTVSDVRQDGEGQAFDVIWTRPDCLRATSTFTFRGPRLEQTMSLDALDGERPLREIVFPMYSFRKLPGQEDELVFPHLSGTVWKHPTTGFARSGEYPTETASVQFVAYYDDLNNGVYAGLEATDGALRMLSVTGKGGILNYQWKHNVLRDRQPGEKVFVTDGPAVMEVYHGNWYDGAQVYKRFLEARASWYVRDLPRQDTPQWYRDNLAWIASSAGGLEFHQYMAKYLELPYAVWWCAWEEVSRGEPPTLSICENLCSLEKMHTIQNLGVRLVPYVNCRLWAFDTIPHRQYSRVNEPGALANGVRLENGTIFTEKYPEEEAVMCAAAPGWQEVLLKNVEYLDSIQADGVYFDQLPCSNPVPCYNPDHGHRLGDTSAWNAGYRKMLQTAKRRFPHLPFAGEDNSEVYAGDLDGFTVWRFTKPNQVPMFQCLYGGGRCQFVGRAFDAFGPGIGTYESSFAKLGEQFVYGEQLGWMHSQDIRFGTPRRAYLKKLMHLRKVLLPYFNASDMAHLPLHFRQPPQQMTCVWGNTDGRTVTTDKLLHCGWRRVTDGRVMIAFTNTVEDEQVVEPLLDYFPDCTHLAICREGQPQPEFIEIGAVSSLPPVRLAGHASEIWLLGKDFDQEEASAISATMAKIATFGEDGGQAIPLPTDFTVKNQLVAESNKWLTANDASWMVLAFRPNHPGLGYNPGSKRHDENANWIYARKGAVISFGEVDFGDQPPMTLTLEVAISKDEAGGHIAVYDITGDAPDRLLAEWNTESTGRWFDFREIELPCLCDVTGKRLIIIKAEGKDCKLRAWKVRR